MKPLLTLLATHKTLAAGLVAGLALCAVPALAGTVTVKDTGSADQVYGAKRVALLIGVDTYADPELETLRFAGKDARDVAAALRDPVTGDYDEVHVLTGKDATSRDAIVKKLKEITAGLQRDDTFLLYLSGHGTLTLDPIDGTRLWFLPSDAKLATPEDRGLEVAWLEETLTELVPRRRVLIMDTCHNGRADGSRAVVNSTTRDRLSSLRGEPPAPNPVSEVTESEARLYAAQYYQPAMEDKSLQNGVYTHYLLEALGSDRRTADLDGNGLVDVTEAHDYAQDRTVRHTGGLQVPRAEYRVSGREAIYLAGDPGQRTRAERALISGYDDILVTARLLVDGQARGSLPSVVAIEPGKHRLEILTTDGRTVYAENVRLKAGDHLQIEDLQPLETTVSLHVGAVATLNAESLPIGAGELELGVRPKWAGEWKPGFHLRSSYGATTRDLAARWSDIDQYDLVGVMPSAGVSVAYQLRDDLLIGPELEAGVMFRQGTCVDDAFQCQERKELWYTVMPGLRAEWMLPVGKGDVSAQLRYDVRAVPLMGPGTPTQLGVAQGLSVGVAF